MPVPLSRQVAYLWARQLFPAAPEPHGPASWWQLALVVVMPALLLWPAGGFPLFEPDEGRYAQIALEMRSNGSVLVPTLQGEPYLDKPPLFYWLVRLGIEILGDSRLALRAVPSLSVQLTILAVYLLGRRSVGNLGAFAAAMLLTVTPAYVSVARLLILDGTLTLFVTLSTLLAYEAIRTGTFRRGYWVLAAVASGLGFLTKGPISEVLLFPPLYLAANLSRTAVVPRVRAGLGFLAVVALVNLPWYVAMAVERPDFIWHFFWEHNVMRFARPFDHLQPVWYYLPVLFGGFMPGVLAGVAYLKTFTLPRPVRSEAGGFWLLAGCWAVFFFSCSGSKLPTYVMPALPPLCLALGEALARTGWLRSRLTVTLWLAAYLVMAGLQWAFVPWYATLRSPLREPGRVIPYVSDPSVRVVTHPRHVDSVAVAVGRADFVQVRSKDLNQLFVDCHFRERTVVLLTHEHSYRSLLGQLPPSLVVETHVDYRATGTAARAAGLTPWGLCDLVVIRPVTVQSR